METKYPHLFSPYTIGKFTFRNRIIASPNMSGWPTREGSPDVNCLYDMVARAKGGAAVVTMGETAVNRYDAVRGYVSFLDQEHILQGSVITPMHLHGKLVEAVNRISAEKNALYRGRVEKVLCEGPSKRNSLTMCGRTDGFKLVNFRGSKEMVGQMVDIEITEGKTFSLEGRVRET